MQPCRVVPVDLLRPFALGVGRLLAQDGETTCLLINVSASCQVGDEVLPSVAYSGHLCGPSGSSSHTYCSAAVAARPLGFAAGSRQTAVIGSPGRQQMTIRGSVGSPSQQR